MKPLAFALLLFGCAGGTLRIQAPTPFGPAQIDVTWQGQVTSLENTGQHSVVNGVRYEVYRDNLGGRWLRDPNPPNRIVPEPTSPQGENERSVLNPRQTTRAVLHDFRGQSYAGLCSRAELDALTGRGSERFAGAQVVRFDFATNTAHVVYSMRADLGIPHPDAHPEILFDFQHLPGPTAQQGFLSVAIEGRAVHVGRYLLAQGVTRLSGVPVEYADTVYTCSATIDPVARVLALWYGSHLLRAIPL